MNCFFSDYKSYKVAVFCEVVAVLTIFAYSITGGIIGLIPSAVAAIIHISIFYGFLNAATQGLRSFVGIWQVDKWRYKQIFLAVLMIIWVVFVLFFGMGGYFIAPVYLWTSYYIAFDENPLFIGSIIAHMVASILSLFLAIFTHLKFLLEWDENIARENAEERKQKAEVAAEDEKRRVADEVRRKQEAEERSKREAEEKIKEDCKMSNEIALTAKASKGDLDAMVDLGGLYAGENKISEAITWWRKAAQGGHGGAAHNLLMTYMMFPDPSARKDFLTSFYVAPQSGNRDPHDFRGLAGKLADYDNGWAKILYGVIVSGGNHMLFVKAFGEDAYVGQRDPKKGQSYIEAGVKLAGGSLDYFDYSAIVSAYYRPVDSKEKGIAGHTVDELRKAKEYSSIALSKVQFLDIPAERKAEYEKQLQGSIATFEKQISDRS